MSTSFDWSILDEKKGLGVVETGTLVVGIAVGAGFSTGTAAGVVATGEFLVSLTTLLSNTETTFFVEGYCVVG